MSMSNEPAAPQAAPTKADPQDLQAMAPERRIVERRDIPGWGIDADPRNDPTYPMRDRTFDDGPGMNWERPATQASDVKILQSIEHVRTPAVFGTSTPPSGVSGAIRNVAFDYSESQWAHWLLLMLADRVNVLEGVAEDLARGHVPNLFEERGTAAAHEHDPKPAANSLVATVAVAGAMAGLGYMIFRSRDRQAPAARPVTEPGSGAVYVR